MITAADVYAVLGLPTGLRLHMTRTVAIVEEIAEASPRKDSWATDEAALAMALHDVGNVVMPVGDGTLLVEPEDRLDRWNLYASLARARYGEDAHQATEKILRELGVRRRLRDLVQRKSSSNLPSILKVADPAELLALYADMRVSPAGVVSISKRHEDAVIRYANDSGRKGLGGDITLTDLRKLESEIARQFDLDPSEIDSTTVEARLDESLALDLTDAFE